SAPRNAKIFGPTFATPSPSQGSSRHAPGLARQYTSSSSGVIRPSRAQPATLAGPTGYPAAQRSGGAPAATGLGVRERGCTPSPTRRPPPAHLGFGQGATTALAQAWPGWTVAVMGVVHAQGPLG